MRCCVEPEALRSAKRRVLCMGISLESTLWVCGRNDSHWFCTDAFGDLTRNDARSFFWVPVSDFQVSLPLLYPGFDEMTASRPPLGT